jgi:RNA polymerase sigma factor (sigma-70 family)
VTRLLGMDRRERALAALYEAEYSSFIRMLVASGRSPEAAHDAVQDGFAQALERRAQFRGGSLRAWVWRIVARRLLDADRRGLSEPSVVEAFAAVSAEDGPASFVVTALRQLPPRRRLVVFLRFYADLSYAEIAECLGVAEGTIAATLSQAYAALRESLQDEVEVKR